MSEREFLCGGFTLNAQDVEGKRMHPAQILAIAVKELMARAQQDRFGGVDVRLVGTPTFQVNVAAGEMIVAILVEPIPLRVQAPTLRLQ